MTSLKWATAKSTDVHFCCKNMEIQRVAFTLFCSVSRISHREVSKLLGTISGFSWNCNRSPDWAILTWEHSFAGYCNSPWKGVRYSHGEVMQIHDENEAKWYTFGRFPWGTLQYRWIFDGFEVCSAGLVCSYPAHLLRRGRIALPRVARVVSVARNVDSRRSKSYLLHVLP